MVSSLFKDEIFCWSALSTTSYGIDVIEGDLENGRLLAGVRTLTFSAVYLTINAATNENTNYNKHGLIGFAP